MGKSGFKYIIDLDAAGFGVYGFKVFRDEGSAIAFAKSMARNNPEICVSIVLKPLDPKKNALRVRE